MKIMLNLEKPVSPENCVTALFLSGDDDVLVELEEEYSKSKIGTYKVVDDADEEANLKELHCCGNCCKKGEAVVDDFPCWCCTESKEMIGYNSLYVENDCDSFEASGA